MDAKNKRLVIVGLFTSILLTLLILSIVVVGGNQMFLAGRYKLFANFDDAQGIYVGSIVSLAGIQVGNVMSIRVHPQDSGVIVELSIDKKHQDRITMESTASIKTMGVLGDKFIYIEPAGGQALKDGEIIVSAVKKDFLTTLDDRAGDLNEIGVILKESASLLKDINDKNRAALLMENLTKTSQNLEEITSRKEAQEALISLAKILRKIDQGEGTLGRLINDPSLYDRLMDLTGASSRKRFLKPLIQNSLQSTPDTDTGR